MSAKGLLRSRVTLSLCAVLLAEACNIGIEPLARPDIPALHRTRLDWINQNYIRHETLTEGNALLVAAQNGIPSFTHGVAAT